MEGTIELSDLVGRYITLAPLDKERLGGQCPVCHGNTFRVNVPHQYWGCAVCGTGGNAAKFAALIDQVMGLKK